MPQQQQQLSSWTPFSLTYITYPTVISSDEDSTAFNNIVPQFLALLSLYPIFFICALTTCTIVYKDVIAAYLLAGTLLMAFVTSWLKKMIGQPRPLSGRDEEYGEDENGMPSNHSSVAFFGATFVILYVLVYRPRQRHLQHHRRGGNVGVGKTSSLAIINGKSAKSPSSSSSQSLAVISWLYHHLHTTISALFSFLIAGGCAYSRVYLQYHTWNQVVAGSTLGVGCGLLWYAIFRMGCIQEKLAWLDGMIQELEFMERRKI